MSFRTELEKIILMMPNIATATLNAGFFFAAMLVSLVPGSAATYKKLRELGHQYTLDSEERAQYLRERIKGLVELDKLAAEDSKKMVEEVAPLIQEEAELLSQKRKVELEGEYKLRLLDAKEKGAIQLLDAKESQEMLGTRQDTKFRLKEQETEFRTDMFTRSQAHLEKMTDLKSNLQNAADSFNDATLNNKSITEASTQSITKLNGSMELLIEANLKLQKAIHAYDSIISKGEANSEQENAISKALIKSIQAEKEMETTLATAQIGNKSELKQAFMADVEQKNEKLDKLLYNCSNKTLTKLSDLIQKEITEIQVKISAFSKPSDIEACKKMLDTLTDKLGQIEHIKLDKEEPGTRMNAKL